MRNGFLVAAIGCATLTATGGTALGAAPVTATVPAGHRLVALSYSGAVSTAPARRGKVTLVPPAARFTLHLIGPKGRYAGPVVVGTAKSGRPVFGLRAGARLGVIRRVKGIFVAKVPVLSTDRSRTSTTRNGLPPGARTLGLARGRSAGPAGPGLDQDLDGVPGAYDIDDDGDLILDNLDSAATTAGIAQLPPPPGGPAPGTLGPGTPGPVPGTAGAPRIFSNLKLPIDGSLNANAGVTRAEVDAALSGNSTLAIAVPGGDEVELDCGTLPYCTTGGTGTILNGGGAFPASADGDGDGYGTITRGPGGDFQLKPGAVSTAVGSGDAFIWRSTTGGVETLTPGVLNYQFVTTPAIVGYRVGSGAEVGIAYPVAPGAPGTMSSPIAVPASGDVSVTLTLWRPQRGAIPIAETGDWMDIGGLTYSADLPNAPSAPGSAGGPGPGLCRAAYLTSTDANLSATGDGMRDLGSDGVPDPARTLTFTVDLSGCVASRAGESWDSGEALKVDLQARTSDGDNAAQAVWFRRG